MQFRSKLFAVAFVCIVLVTSASSQAAITLQISESAVQPTVQAGGATLIAYDLRAVSDSGQTINTIENPNITAFETGAGLHQVWTPVTNGPTPTRAEQAPPLWSDTWREYDSYWFFDATNSLGVGGAFNETNSQAGGAVLPTAGFGAPVTGFGGMSSVMPASKLFTVASGLPDADVTFGQLVLKQGEGVHVDLTVYDNTGESAIFTDFCVGECGDVDDFEVNDLFLQGYIPGALVTGGPLPTNATAADIAWSLVSLTGPGGAVAGATVDPATGVFSWQSAGDSPFGAYTATIQGINAGTPAGTDSGLLTFNLVPEPASITLLGLAMVGAFGFIRRR